MPADLLEGADGSVAGPRSQDARAPGTGTRHGSGAVRYAVLGPLRVEGADGRLATLAPKQRSLLGVLLVNANRVVASDRLIDLLWNSRPPSDAMRALHVHLTHVRRVLDPERPRRARDLALVRQSPGYLLNVERGELDLERFESLLGRARRARACGDLHQAEACLRQALELWRGPALADVEVEALRQTVGRRLEEARLAAIEERADVDLLLGRHAELVGELEALVAEHPTRERMWMQLMVARYRAGQQVEALAAYTRLRARLVDELGIEPGAQARRLQRQILAADPELDAPPPAPAADPGR